MILRMQNKGVWKKEQRRMRKKEKFAKYNMCKVSLTYWEKKTQQDGKVNSNNDAKLESKLVNVLRTKACYLLGVLSI